MERLNIPYEHYNLEQSEIPQPDRELVVEARRAAENSHSPYSNFKVGAAARLRSGEVVVGTNIESEVYPSGLCAERVLLYHAAAIHPNDPVEALAVTSLSSPEECYPCGACRQVLVDTENRQASPMRVIMAGEHTATVVAEAQLLMPFTFKLR